MTADHDLYGHWAAAYAIGALSTDDRREFERHLGSCDICASEVSGFAVLPGMMSQIDPSDIDHVEIGFSVEDLDRALRGEYATMRRSRRRWMAGAAVAGIVAAVLAAATMLTGGESDPDGVVATVIESDAETTSIVAIEKGWGTQISVELSGLPYRDAYHLWAIDDAGAWSAAATWSPTPTGIARLVGASALPTASVDRILVTSASPDDILVEVAV